MGRWPVCADAAACARRGSVHGGLGVRELPDWLCKRITERAPPERRVADPSVVASESTLIDEWSRAVSWVEILRSLGWTPTGRADACGCETWTAPGEHAAPAHSRD